MNSSLKFDIYANTDPAKDLAHTRMGLGFMLLTPVNPK